MKPWQRPNGKRCAWNDCDRQATGKSRYCLICRTEARQAYMARIREQEAQKEARQAEADAIETAIGEATEAADPFDVAPVAAVVYLKDGRTTLAKRLGREIRLRLPAAVAAATVLREAGFACEVRA